MSQMGQTQSFGDVGSMSGLPESGHGWAIYEFHALSGPHRRALACPGRWRSFSGNGALFAGRDSGKGVPDIRANGTKVSAKTLGKIGQDDQDKFSLPTCFGFSEDILEQERAVS
jgi:hypothetical protein